jgi:hypothetical protein
VAKSPILQARMRLSGKQEADLLSSKDTFQNQLLKNLLPPSQEQQEEEVKVPNFK